MARPRKENCTRANKQVQLFRKLALAYLGNKCVVCGTRETLEFHHKDGNWRNDDLTNIELRCKKHHPVGNHKPKVPHKPEVPDGLSDYWRIMQIASRERKKERIESLRLMGIANCFNPT